jgi:IS4 transposase
VIFLVGHKRNPLAWPGREALDPRGRYGAGKRLWKMSGMDLRDYLRSFRRVNAVDDPEFPRGSHLIVLGREAMKRLKERGVVKSWNDWPWFGTRENVQSDLTVTLLPHPSGKNRAYNIPENRDRVREILKDVVENGLRERARLLESRRLDALARQEAEEGEKGDPPVDPAISDLLRRIA